MQATLGEDVDVVVASGITADELARLDDEYRYDLIEGDLIRMSPAGFEHGEIAALLIYWLQAFLRAHPGLGIVLSSETGFRLARDPDTVLAPDVAFVRQSRRPSAAQRRGYAEVAPDLVVEVVSPSDRWTLVNDKVQAYLAAGVQLVWLVDPRREAVQVFTAAGVAPRLTALGKDVLSGGDVLPGFELPLTDLFPAA